MLVTGAVPVSNLIEESNCWRNPEEQEEQGWSGEWVVPEEKQIQEEAAGAAAAFDFACLPSPGKGQIEAARDILRAIFKQCG